MKVLLKFHGNRAKLEEPLLKVLYWCKYFEEEEKIKNIPEKREDIVKEIFGEGGISSEKILNKLKNPDEFFLTHTARKVLEMLYKLYTDGYASYL
ncbi:MAG: hypothetical protein ABDH49_02400 [Candidatus Hydrothermales bacterium]